MAGVGVGDGVGLRVNEAEDVGADLEIGVRSGAVKGTECSCAGAGSVIPTTMLVAMGEASTTEGFSPPQDMIAAYPTARKTANTKVRDFTQSFSVYHSE